MKCTLPFLVIFSLLLSFCSTIHQRYSPVQRADRLFLKGMQFLQNDELVQAEIQFHKALEQKPDFVPALDGLAQIALKRGRLKQAENWLNKISDSKGTWPLVHLTHARMAFYQGEFEKSLQLLTLAETSLQALQTDSLLTEIKILKLRNLIHLNQWQQAKDLLDQLQTNGHLNDEQLRDFAGRAQQLEELMAQIPASCSPFLFKKVLTRAEFSVLVFKMFNPLNSPPKALWQFDPEIPWQQIKDVPSDRNQAKAIKFLLDHHILWAYPDRRFYPGDYLTNGELVVSLQRIALAIDQAWGNVQIATLSRPLEQALHFARQQRLLPLDHFQAQKKVDGVTVIQALLVLRAR